MKVITNYLAYVESSDNPLSAEVYIITGKNYTYIYDVGNNEIALEILNKINNKKIILSHFHVDHIGNINKIIYNSLYVSKKTSLYIENNNYTIVNNKIRIEDDVIIEIIPLVSTHSLGSLIINVNNEYLLVGDSLYGTSKNNQYVYNTQQLKEEIECLEKIDTKMVITSHAGGVIDIEKVINDLKDKYKKREKNNPYIIK